MKYIEHLLKHNRFIQRVYIVVFSALFRFLGIFVKTNPKQVLFQSLKGKNYGDSPRVIFEAMKTDPFFKGYTYVWAFDKPDQFEAEGAKKVRLNSLAYFLTALGSGIWIANVNIERGLQFKKRHTIYLNTWHGCGPLKKDGNSQGNRKDYNFSKTDIVYALDAIQSPMSLYEPIYTDGGDTLYVMDQVSDKKNKEERWIENIAIGEAMKKLNDREREIIELRFFDGKTQMEVAEEISISQAQVSRLEKNALKYMRRYV